MTDATAPEPIPILYADDELIAVAKPPGMPVVPAAGEDKSECVRHRLETQIGAPVWVVHRLDRHASGVLVFARDAGGHRRLSQAFERREVSKAYLALTAGVIEPPAGTIDVALHAARRGRSRPAAAGEPGLASVTDYRLLRTWTRGADAAALVEARPRTGRHHQIRVHLRSKGTPILFDEVYGRATLAGDWIEGPCRRLALHALRIELPSKAVGPPLRLESPLAADLAALVRWFETQWTEAPEPRAAEPGATSWLP